VRHLAFIRQPLSASPAPAPGAPRSPVGPITPPLPIEAPESVGAAADPLVSLDAEQRADRERVLRSLEECAGNQTRAARMLGISRTAFVTKLRVYRIPRPRS